MTNSRVPLATAGAVVIVLIAQAILEFVVTDSVIAQELATPSAQPGFALIQFLLNDGLRIVAYGVGVWLSLRFIARVRATDSWGGAIGRGLIASLLGTAGVAIYAIVGSVLSAVHVSAYPLGYSLSPSLNTGSLASNLMSDTYVVLPTLFEWFPLVVLAVVLMKVWLASRAAVVVEATVPASPVATRAGR